MDFHLAGFTRDFRAKDHYSVRLDTGVTLKLLATTVFPEGFEKVAPLIQKRVQLLTRGMPSDERGVAFAYYTDTNFYDVKLDSGDSCQVSPADLRAEGSGGGRGGESKGKGKGRRKK